MCPIYGHKNSLTKQCNQQTTIYTEKMALIGNIGLHRGLKTLMKLLFHTFCSSDSVHLICTAIAVLVWVSLIQQILVSTSAGLHMCPPDFYRLGIPLYLCSQGLLSPRLVLLDWGC